MRAILKDLSDISNLHDLRVSAKSGKPALPTTAILSLYMRGNEKTRLEKELKRIRKRRVQLLRRVKDVDREMSKLSLQAGDMAEKLRGNKLGKSSSGKKAIATAGKKQRVVVGY
ncbi:MAG: hypothetical protein WAP23_03150 [Candidatus Spechtbacterales bacterium]